jgi:hypothetical protein
MDQCRGSGSACVRIMESRTRININVKSRMGQGSLYFMGTGAFLYVRYSFLLISNKFRGGRAIRRGGP